MNKKKDAKECPKCKITKLLSDFAINPRRRDGVNSWCKRCNQENYRQNKPKYLEQKAIYYRENSLEIRKKQDYYYRLGRPYHMFRAAKSRAKRKNIPFEIQLSDVVIPEICPVLGIPLKINLGVSRFDSPSLDRIIPEKGYVPGNVMVVSLKANQIKNCSTIEELEKVFRFYEKIIKNELDIK